MPAFADMDQSFGGSFDKRKPCNAGKMVSPFSYLTEAMLKQCETAFISDDTCMPAFPIFFAPKSPLPTINSRPEICVLLTGAS